MLRFFHWTKNASFLFTVVYVRTDNMYTAVYHHHHNHWKARWGAGGRSSFRLQLQLSRHQSDHLYSRFHRTFLIMIPGMYTKFYVRTYGWHRTTANCGNHKKKQLPLFFKAVNQGVGRYPPLLSRPLIVHPCGPPARTTRSNVWKRNNLNK